MHVQPPVDRSPFTKRGLSPAPLQQTLKSLASQEIKQQQGKSANRRWEGPPTLVMAKEERVNGYPCFWHIWQQRSEDRGLPSMVCQRWPHQTESIVSPANTSTVHRPQWHTARVGWAGGQSSVALTEVELVPRLLSRALRRPRGVPYPTKHWGLKNTCTVSLSVLSPGVRRLE